MSSGQYVHLQKAGRTFKAPCPFHTEKTPSFIVNPDRQTWHCFGACGTGGDVISFVMKREGIEFGEALRMLAERAGVKLKERRVSEEQDRARAAAVRRERRGGGVLPAPADDGRRARSHAIMSSGGRSTTRRRGRSGWGTASPAGRDLLEHLRGLRFTDREIVGAGLALQGDNGLHDRFRNRLMFPVWDAKGRMIGFGARALDDALPKYLNTAQTPLFDKSGTLYALNKAGEAIRREGRAVIVEGYMDVIAAHQYGFTNVVAQMGTALTERQVRLLKRLTGQTRAGAGRRRGRHRGGRPRPRRRPRAERAETGATPVVSWRGLVGYQETSAIDLRVVVVPHGKDPDDFIRDEPGRLARADRAGAAGARLPAGRRGGSARPDRPARTLAAGAGIPAAARAPSPTRWSARITSAACHAWRR